MPPNVTQVAPDLGKDGFFESHWVRSIDCRRLCGLLAGIYLHDRAAARAGLGEGF